MDKKIYIILAGILVVGLVVGSAFIGLDFDNEEEEPDNGFEEARPQLEQQLRQQKENELIMQHLIDLREAAEVKTYPEAIEEGEPGDVIFTINGEDVFKQSLLDFEHQERQQLAMRGVDPNSEQADQMIEQMRPDIVDNLVANTALAQKVKEVGITPSEDDIEWEYQLYVGQTGSEEELEAQLARSGFTLEDLREAIAEQLAINTYVVDYIAENLSDEDLNFSDEELRELYEQMLEQQQMQQQMPVG